MQGGNRHEHIASVRWQDPGNGTADVSTREAMVAWIRKGNRAFVTDGRNTVDVLVVNAHPPYLRTYADGKWTDNLLALPRF